MLEKTEEIIVGIKIVMLALGINKAIVGIENNKKDAIALFKKFTENEPDIQVAALRLNIRRAVKNSLSVRC
ncbi:MAG: hypothetical protein U5K51_11965 [Flavobacteriaceae bacterium]|nr:hypothetical protein [Flavobacteriaceae bacterium]